MNHRKFLCAGLFALLSVFLLSSATQIYSQEDVIEKRKKIMKSNSKAAKAIKKAAKEKDFGTVAAKAKEISANMAMLPDLFPKGSTAENSRAKPEIWGKWKSFMGKVKSNTEVADMLAESAMAKDGDMVATLAKGIDCKSCHKSFRKPKKKKKK